MGLGRGHDRGWFQGPWLHCMKSQGLVIPLTSLHEPPNQTEGWGPSICFLAPWALWWPLGCTGCMALGRALVTLLEPGSPAPVPRTLSLKNCAHSARPSQATPAPWRPPTLRAALQVTRRGRMRRKRDGGSGGGRGGERTEEGLSGSRLWEGAQTAPECPARRCRGRWRPPAQAREGWARRRAIGPLQLHPLNSDTLAEAIVTIRWAPPLSLLWRRAPLLPHCTNWES